MKSIKNALLDNLGLMIITIMFIVGLWIINKPNTLVCNIISNTQLECYPIK